MLLNENQIDEWVRGNARDAQGIIVELVWRLIAASSQKPKERRFPLGDSIGQHGPDGVLDATISYDPFVPEGRSFWEIGTNVRAGDKATEDYTGLTAATPADVRAQSTFVFVTPLSGRRDWEHTWKPEAQATWLEERRKRGEWKDVRVIDGTKLIDWLHHFPAVELWLAEKTVRVPANEVEIPRQRWGLLETIGQPPPLITDLFLVNRDEARKALEPLLNGTTVQLKLATHFPEQAVDFVCAYIAALPEDERAEAEGRCVIVSGADAWTALAGYREKLILIADPALDLDGQAGMKLIQLARRGGHSIVFGGPPGGLPDPASVRLATPRSQQLQDSLQKAGYPEERARVLAQKADGNLGVLLRCIQNLSLLPAWAEGTPAAELIIAELLGGWNDKLEGDRRIIEELSGKAFGEWIGKAHEAALRPGTPLNQRDGVWRFIARYEGWYALGPRVLDDQLERLGKAARKVLGEDDPQFELPPKERYAASLHGKVLKHSEQLRTGLAQSMALLGSHPKALSECTLGKPETVATVVVRELLDGSDWIRWSSLNSHLPLLAEAAPGAFLAAVDTALKKNPCPFDEMFKQEDTGITGRTYMSGILWALETLAWDPDYLIHAVMCLGELASRDPGGNWANRPSNSLTTIFLPWLPQTVAPLEKRKAALATLLTELPEVGWKVLISLLPESHSVSSGCRRPEWRPTIPETWTRGVSGREYSEQVKAYSEMAIATAKLDSTKLAELISHLDKLTPAGRDAVLQHLSSDAVKALRQEERHKLWQELSRLVAEHRKFSDADWALEAQEVDKIAAVADGLAPASPLLRYQRLFTQREFDLYDRQGSYEEQRQALEKRRQDAIREIMADGGLDAVRQFLANVDSPGSVGFSLGSISGKESDAMLLPGSLVQDPRADAQFIGGYIWARYRQEGWAWADSLNKEAWTPDQIGQFFAFLPFTPETWERCSKLLGGNELPYWKRTSANPYEAKEGLNHAIDRLVDFGRPVAAISCLSRMLHDKQEIDPKRAARALIAALTTEEQAKSMDGYELEDVIKGLQDHPKSDADDLFHIEWAYLPLLTRHGGKVPPRTLERRLASDPKFFCEAIRLVFRSKKEAKPREERSEKEKAMAQNAYQLLSEWAFPPGSKEDGSFDAAALTTWLDAVKQECSESGHLEIAMTMVGHAMVHVPSDPSGLWINLGAAAVLNAKEADQMRDGFRTELYNQRGAHWVDPTGKPERELAEKFRKRAEDLETAGLHRLASSIRELSQGYEREAERVIADAQKDD